MSDANSTPAQGIFQPINHLTLAQAAAYYAEMGFKVFPLQPGSKLPMQGWPWKRMATSDVATVRSWWQQWPSANIGLALGENSGVDALDIDVKNGQDGRRSYQAITQAVYDGPVQSTPTGGQHMLFKHTPGLINFTHRGTLGGLDMRTTGGYIVAAPSQTAEGPYWWSQDGKVPAMPEALHAATLQWSTQQNTEVVDAPEIPEDLPDVATLGLRSHHLGYLQDGDTSAWQGDESRALFSVAGALMQRLNNAGLVYGILCANPYAWACAERHRPFGDVSAWLWKYGIGKIVSAAQARCATDVFSPLPIQQDTAGPSSAPLESFFSRGSEGVSRACLAPQWVVRGIMERGQVGLLYGDSQALKSYLMLDMSVAIAAGRKWHGMDVVAPGPVWFLAGEGNAILWRRLEAMRQVNGIHSEELKNLWLSSQGLNLMNTQHLQFLRSQVEACDNEPPRMLVVDTLSSNAVLDENNARDAAELISICYGMAHEWGTTVVLVHHVGKTNKGAVRGSSVLQSNTDFRLRVEREQGQRIITHMTVEKLKGAPEPADPFVFEADVHPIVGVLDDDMVPVSDLVLKRIECPDAETRAQEYRRQANLGEAARELYGIAQEFITSHWTMGKPGAAVLREELAEEYRARTGKAGDRAFAAAVKQLLAQGLLLMDSSPDAVLLSLPGGQK